MYVCNIGLYSFLHIITCSSIVHTQQNSRHFSQQVLEMPGASSHGVRKEYVS